MTVFDAFPNAFEAWKIGTIEFGTITGNRLGEKTTIHVIVDRGDSARQTNSPNAAVIESDTLLYCRPEELPTTDPSELVGDYAVQDAQNRTYAIEDAGVGKNQHTGAIEHVELKLKPLGVIEDDSSES